jgi:hypothetical protein
MAESPALKPVYLLTGSDRPKIETALTRLRRHFEPEATEIVSAQERSGGEAAALCNAGSLFGDARLVLVEGVDGRRNSEGRLANGWKAADVKAIEEYLASPAPGTVLALVAEELKKDAPLTKACAKVGEVLAYEVAKRNVNQWVADRFRQAGARAEPDACAALIHLVGEDFHQLANEIDKLALWAGDEPGGLGLLARGGVLVQRAAGGALVDRAHELQMLGGELVLVAFGRCGFEPLGQRLHRRAVAEVLLALALGDPDTLFLLLNIRHFEERPALGGRAGS